MLSNNQSFNKKPICFVISPIGEEGSEIRQNSEKLYNYILKPVVEKLGYDITRSDKISEPGMITTQIINHVINSELVIADLTGHNANVFYELAIRHATKKHYIQLIQRGRKIPFDVQNLRTIYYDFDIEEAEQAKAELNDLLISSQRMEEVENPISNAINFQAVKVSEDPDKQIMGRIFEMVQNIYSTVESIKEKNNKEKIVGKDYNLNLRHPSEYEKLLDDWRTVLDFYDDLDNYVFPNKKEFNDIVNQVRNYFPLAKRFIELDDETVTNTRLELLKSQIDLRKLHEHRRRG